MKTLPFLLAIIVYGISYHGMFIFSEQFRTDPIYCKTNALPEEYNTCTKYVALGGYMVLIVPIVLGLGIYVMTDYIQKKEEELMIKND